MRQAPALLCVLLSLALGGCVAAKPDPKTDPAKSAAAAATASAALKSLQVKASAGDAEAQNELAGDYRDGTGVPQDWGMDYFWNSLAAAQSQEVSDRAMISRNVAAEHLTPEQQAILDKKISLWKPTPPPPPPVLLKPQGH